MPLDVILHRRGPGRGFFVARLPGCSILDAGFWCPCPPVQEPQIAQNDPDVPDRVMMGVGLVTAQPKAKPDPSPTEQKQQIV